MRTRSAQELTLADIDMRPCPSREGGEFKIIAAIRERQVIEKVLIHLGFHPPPPPRVPERRPVRYDAG